MEIKSKNYAQAGFAICAISVLFGAMGTHLIEDAVSERHLQTFETAVRYQFIHGLAMALLAINYRKLNDKYMQYIMPLFVFSILVFCGSLYLLVFFSIFMGDDFNWLGAIAPIGGAGFILGWALLALKGFDVNDTLITDSEKEKKKRERRHSRRSSSSNADIQKEEAN